MTREHVIPSFAYSFQKQLESSIIGWNEVAGKMVHGEMKVKDVCSNCNNVLLSELDAAGKSLLVQNGLLVPNFRGTSLSLRYDYDLLLRWLLKISFNSARTDGVHEPLFVEHIPYMLGDAPTPRRSRIGLLAYLAAPVNLTAEQLAREPYKTASGGGSIFNPFIIRICYGYVPGNYSYTLRLMILGPLVFHLLIFNDELLPGHAATALRRHLRLTPGAQEVRRDRKYLMLRPGPLSWLDLYQDQLVRAKAMSA